MLRHRLITGPLLIALILGIVWLDSALEGGADARVPRGSVLVLLALAVVPLIAREMAGIVGRVGIATSVPVAIGASYLLFVGIALASALRSPLHATALASTALLGVLLAGILRFARGQTIQGVIAATGALLLVSVYSGALLAFWVLLRRDHSAWVLVGAILTTKSSDIGAYFTGVSIGRNKLIPWLSPGKTWEGLAGGVATAAVVGALLALASAHLPDARDRIPWLVGAVGGVIVALVGQFGDLVESLFKREAGLKDSGTLVPGMGGVLDVLDSPLMAGPAVYWLLAT